MEPQKELWGFGVSYTVVGTPFIFLHSQVLNVFCVQKKPNRKCVCQSIILCFMSFYIF